MFTRILGLFSSPTKNTPVTTNFCDEIEVILDEYAIFEQSIANKADKIPLQIAYLEKVHTRLQAFAHPQALDELGLEDLLDVSDEYVDILTYSLLDLAIEIKAPGCNTPITIGLYSLMELASDAKEKQTNDIQHPYRGTTTSVGINREKTLEINEFTRLLLKKYSKDKPLTEASLKAEKATFQQSQWKEKLEYKFKKRQDEHRIRELKRARLALVKRIENPQEENYPQLTQELDTIDKELAKITPINTLDTTETLKERLYALIAQQEITPADKNIPLEMSRILATLENRLDAPLEQEDTYSFVPSPSSSHS